MGVIEHEGEYGEKEDGAEEEEVKTKLTATGGSPADYPQKKKKCKTGKEKGCHQVRAGEEELVWKANEEI
ncbi:hypothetical protein RUM43_003347 [Polyplax serrata]|uniref:Uncharacterized protein n=1 Tax=Polyplax serrata TaxID=468196 RepID=A0AAN8P355_POLSC